MAIEDLQIVVAHGSDDIRTTIHGMIDDRHHVTQTCGTVVELKSIAAAAWPDLVICGVTFPDGDGLDTVIELGRTRPMPAVVVTSRRSIELVEKAMRDHVMAYLFEPVTKEDLEAAIVVAWSRFQELRELEEEVADLRLALDHRKIIERAKGMLMADEGLTEAEAFGQLRRRAQDSRTRMVDVANDIVDRMQNQADLRRTMGETNGS